MGADSDVLSRLLVQLDLLVSMGKVKLRELLASRQ